jgi:outer membrane protein
VSALARSNLKSTLDVSFANVNLADARLLLANAQSDVRTAYAELATAMGLPAQYAQGGFSLAPDPMPDPLPATLDPLLDTALRDRPQLANLRLEQNSAQRFAQAEKDLVLPTIGVAAAAGFVPAGEVQVPGRYGAAGVNVTIPILNGHLFRARRTEAELRVKAAEQNINDLANRVSRDVRVAYLNAPTVFERLALTAQLLDQARLALDLAQRRYDIGLGSIVELSQAQLNVTAAEIAGSSAQFDYQSSAPIWRIRSEHFDKESTLSWRTLYGGVFCFPVAIPRKLIFREFWPLRFPSGTACFIETCGHAADHSEAIHTGKHHQQQESAKSSEEDGTTLPLKHPQ